MLFGIIVSFFVILTYEKCEGFTAKQMVYPDQKENFELSILHLNDFHAHFVEKPGSIGGLARVITALQEMLDERPNPIFLNAGDHYQGTLWYNVHRWNATVHFMNKLPHDAMTIGNHDFDDKIAGLVPFLQRVESPVVVTNIDDSEEPSIKGLYKNSTIITRKGKKIGVIGVILQSTNTLSSTGKLKFLDEVSTVNSEAKRLKTQGVEVILVLSHCGLATDKIMAAKCPDIDVIVGGHSHSFLYSGKPPNQDIPEDEYPVVVTQKNTNRTVLIVQAAAYTKYLGNLTVWFDSQGEVVDWEGNPITLDATVQQDVKMLKDLEPWAEAVDELGKNIVGETQSYLSSSCRSGECNLANLITDAMVHAYKNQSDNPLHWTYAAISCINAGGIRSDIKVGNITYGDVISTQPFENTWDTVEIMGKDFKNVLEESVLRSHNPNKFVGKGFFHWSGIKVVYNISRPAYSRINNLMIRCQKCSTPKYEKLNENHWYRLIIPSLIMTPGDISLPTIKKKHRNHKIGVKDIDSIVDYVKFLSPFKYDIDHRLTLVGEWRG